MAKKVAEVWEKTADVYVKPQVWPYVVAAIVIALIALS